MMGGLAWLGLFLSLNQTAPLRDIALRPALAAKATAVVGLGHRMSVTIIYIEPITKPAPRLLSIGIGVRVF